MTEISERREVRVRGDDATFVFAAEPDAGRLVIREDRGQGDGEELCALTISDREELSGFLQGLRRVLGVDDAEEDAAPIEQPPQGGRRDPGRSRDDAGRLPAGERGGDEPREERDGDDRRAAMERARSRGQSKAFAPWTRDEEQRLLEAVRAGRDLDELAREHQRSRRALELRLERLQR